MRETDVPGTIEAMLLTSGRFKMKTMLRQVRLSRTAILKHLSRMVDSGELVRQGGGAGTHYVRGPGWGGAPSGTVRTSERNGFWAAVLEGSPRAAYIELFTVLGPRATRRSQARRALGGLMGRDFIVVDFHRVEHVNETFVQELLFGRSLDMGNAWVEPINVHSSLQSIIERVLRLRDARRGRGEIPWGRGPTQC